MSSTPPPPNPAVTTQTVALDAPSAASPVVSSPPTPPAGTTKPSPKVRLASAFAVARVATAGVRRRSSSVQEGDKENTADTESGRETRVATSGLSMRGVFRRGSRTEKETSEQAQRSTWNSKQPPLPVPEKAELSGARVTPTRSPRVARPQEDEENERSDLFGGSALSPGKSPRPTTDPRRSAFSPSRGEMDRKVVDTAFVSPAKSGEATAPVATRSSSLPSSGGERKGRRAFAGGLWGGGDSSAPSACRIDDAVSSEEAAAALAEATTGAQAVERVSEPQGNAPSGEKRRFAGGCFSGPTPPPSSSVERSNAQNDSNPFGASDVSDRGASATGQASREMAKSVSACQKPRAPQVPKRPVPAPDCGVGGDGSSVPAWAADGGGVDAAGSSTPSLTGGKAWNGTGLAPPSTSQQGQDEAARSPFMAADDDAPVARRPRQRRPGEAGSRKAFGGGQRLF